MTMVLAPKTTINILPADTRVPNASQRVLLVGEIGTTPTVNSGEIIENVQAPPENTDPFDPYFWTPGSPEILFGADSELCRMIREFKAINPVTQLDAYAYPVDGTGTPSLSHFSLAGTATSDGVITFQVTSPFYEISVPITNGDTAEDIIAACSAAMIANPTLLVAPVIVGLTQLQFEPKSRGYQTASSSAFRMLEMTATGITFDDTDSPTPNPAITRAGSIDLVAAIGDQRYQTIVYPYPELVGDPFSDPTSGIGALFNNFNADNALKDFMMFTGYPFADDGANDPLATGTYLDTTNEQMLAFFTDTGPKIDAVVGLVAPFDACFNIFDYTPVILSKLAAIRSLRLSEGEEVSQYVIARQGLLDAFGGPALASKPYFNTPLPGATVVDSTGFGLSSAQQQTALDKGGFTANLNRAGTETIFGQVPTTYKFDNAGNPDISYKFVNYVDTISNSREYFFNNLKKRFAQSRLTNGDVLKGRDMANAETISAYCESLYQDLSGRDFVLVEAGEEATAFFKANLIVVIDTSLGRATVNMKVPIVTQLREIRATMQISFGTEG